MRLTSDVITNARAYYNALKQRELDIRGIRIPVMENLGAAQNQFDVIDLSDNSITKIENIPKFDRLNTLLLSNNLISRIASGLGANVPNCENLNLSNNRIEDFGELEHLKDWKHLSNLSLIDNPIVVEKDFRARVVAILPQLTVLNFQRVTQKDREAAKQYMTSE
ncbi:leucine-rich repeat-containing protein [Blastocystis sp. ATCC 50177/Nand II]|uniref:Leucine-rich repeat-containing protein n=1 Tax=Blastocystis sp. subtype 1 (strain ATCC 50177 / NandII) TaxID=478820 RepID=A0A196SF49_BLAHN|nr:leucine-rich repeat-containing protein [Blastocystis sp. ATCC 50177/Nand II]